MRTIPALILICISGIIVASEGEASPWLLENHGLSLTFESVELPGKEHMSLLGISYSLPAGAHWFYGGGAYAALFGERGGFFTGGFCGGWRGLLAENLEYELALFAGGGGGGSAPQGGGLMLRPSVALHYIHEHTRFGLGASQVRFPNGSIESRGAFISYRAEFETLTVRGRGAGPRTVPYALGRQAWEYSFSMSRYHPLESSRSLAGNPYSGRIQLVGFGVRRFLNRELFVNARVHGAVDGGVDGYAKFLLGPGMTFRPADSDRVVLDFSLLIGGSGGGGVDTGGGLIIQPEAGLTLSLSSALALEVRTGYLHPLDGYIDAWVSTLGIVYTFDGYRLMDSGPAGRRAEIAPWRISGRIKSYVPDRSLHNKNGQTHDETIRLAGFGLDRFMSDKWYLCGQAWGAFEGEAGGYAEGLIGTGVSWAVSDPLSLEAEVLIGAGGGGGIDVSGGMIAEIMLGGEYRFNATWSLSLKAGWMEALAGSFEAPVYTLAVGRSFGQLIATGEN